MQLTGSLHSGLHSMELVCVVASSICHHSECRKQSHMSLARSSSCGGLPHYPSQAPSSLSAAQAILYVAAKSIAPSCRHSHHPATAAQLPLLAGCGLDHQFLLPCLTPAPSSVPNGASSLPQPGKAGGIRRSRTIYLCDCVSPGFARGAQLLGHFQEAKEPPLLRTALRDQLSP